MRARFLMAVLALLSGPYLAQPAAAQSLQDVTTVKCTTGQGCRCALSGINAYDVAWLLNWQDPPANADTLILMIADGVTRWSSVTPDQADTDYGGDGTCEIEVFSPVIPADGTWAGKVRAQDITGCAPQVAEMVPGMLVNMTFSRQIPWKGHFDPALLSADPTSQIVRWRALHANLFAGQLTTPVKSDVLQVTGALSSRLLTPDTATATLRLRVGTDAKNAGVLAALGMADCRVTAIYDFERAGQ